MKKILLSAGMIALVGTLAVGGTIAFYNDTETSAGNIFVAGSIDLKVDHLKQTYNGVDCKTCDVSIISDASNLVIEKDGEPVTPYNAFVLPDANQAGDWANETSISANWIWGAAGNPPSPDNTKYIFEKKFTWFGPVEGVALDLSISGDDNYTVFLNEALVAERSFPDDGLIWKTIVSETGFEDEIIQGENTLTFVVLNTGGPAGLLYRLTIDGNCEVAYFQSQCRLWDEKDLGEGDTFFNFNDIKPGDFGTNVISLRVYDNDAYACLLTSNEDDQENVIVDPETTAGDLPNVGNQNGFGELSQFIKVFAWNDADNDGLYEGEATLLSSNTPLVDIELLQLSLTGGGPTAYVGLAWCAGTQNVVGNVISCNGATMGDIAQTDSFTASLTAYAEQIRNNPTFSCANVVLNP